MGSSEASNRPPRGAAAPSVTSRAARNCDAGSGSAAVTLVAARVPAPPADGLAAARGRDARALRRPRLARAASSSTSPASAAVRRCTSCSPGPSPISASASGPSARLRRVRASPACRSSRCSAAGSRAAGQRSSRSCILAAELDVPLPRRLRTDVQPVPLPLCLLVPRPTPCARPRRVGAGRSGPRRSSLTVAAHPYGALVLAAQARTSCSPRRDRLRAAAAAGAAVLVLGIPFWLTDLVLAGRFDVGVGSGGEKLGGPAEMARYLWRIGRRLLRGLVAGARRRPRAGARARRPVGREARLLALCRVGVAGSRVPRTRSSAARPLPSHAT